jgi:hypothetical protein
MNNRFTSFWPSAASIQMRGGIWKTPYQVLEELAESINMVYPSLQGFVTASYKTVGSVEIRSDFSYSLYARNEVKMVQLRILDVEIGDDGWYPVLVTLPHPEARKDIIASQTEFEFENALKLALNDVTVLVTLQSLL